MTDKKCIKCREREPSYCFSCYEDKGEAFIQQKEWERLQIFVETIFNHYPQAHITGFFLGGKAGENCFIHFHVGCGGSDSVCVNRKGRLYQILSGDLDMDYLSQLEEKLRDIADPIPSLQILYQET